MNILTPNVQNVFSGFRAIFLLPILLISISINSHAQQVPLVSPSGIDAVLKLTGILPRSVI